MQSAARVWVHGEGENLGATLLRHWPLGSPAALVPLHQGRAFQRDHAAPFRAVRGREQQLSAECGARHDARWALRGGCWLPESVRIEEEQVRHMHARAQWGAASLLILPFWPFLHGGTSPPEGSNGARGGGGYRIWLLPVL